MKKLLNVLLGLMLALCLCFVLAACGTHSCVDDDKNHKCDTCEESMGEHSDGDDADHLCDYGCGQVADDGCHGITDGICDECGKTFTTKEVFVTIANKGELVMTQEKILAVDKNEDAKIDIDEVLFAAHEAKYEGGAAAGYSSYTGDYGLSLGTLWGDNSGSFGYRVNNASAWSLADEVAENGYVYAFVYKDTTAWSDSYSFFNVNTANAAKNGTLELVLNGAGYDADWNPITVPVAGATITVNGVATEYVTDSEGKATIKLDTVGNFVISATSENSILVPPVCKVTVNQSAEVFVTVANKGTLVMTQEKILAVDRNGDDKINIDEVLFAAHEAKYEGGAAAGYSSYTGDYGLSLGTLWGDNSGAFGYYVNNASAWGLSDEVTGGDSVYAFVYTDTTYWSDSYSFFNVNTASVAENGEVELVLNSAGYDAEWNPITVPVAGATITVNGVATDYVTDAEGKVTVKLENADHYVISATSTAATLVPPVCVITVEAAQAN
ncbi:MAG: hypothetical protein IJW92_03545 [Clostridia bacterium]|nr:hypothetical protein [Clostridia bacterium]